MKKRDLKKPNTVELQLTLNICNTSIQCSIKRYAATTHIEVSGYLLQLKNSKNNMLLIYGFGYLTKIKRKYVFFTEKLFSSEIYS